MTDQPGRRPEADDEDWDELPEPVFADESVDEVPLRFGPDESGPLPHWTEPPTGELPRIFADQEPAGDVDVWSSFAGQSAPVWRDAGGAADDTSMVADLGLDDEPRLGALGEEPLSAGDLFPDLDEAVHPADRDEPGHQRSREPIRIGSDWTGEAPGAGRARTAGPGTGRAPRREPDESRPTARPGPSTRSGRPVGGGGTAGRDMPTAVAIGLGLAAVFVLLVKFAGSTGVMVIVVAVLTLGAVEFFEKTQARGHRPATFTGVLSAALLPLAAYWQGEIGLAVGVFVAVVATMLTMMNFHSVEGQPLVNAAISVLGIVWIGVLGAFAGLILRFADPLGTDTIFALVVAVVANDVGALLVGSAGGRTPLRAWISPNKTIEGVIGGTVVTIGAMVLLNIANSHRTTWIGLGDCVALGVAVAVLAPIGDLTESMFKRSLDIKDFGTILPGHGGILDRFDGFLFTLPAAYYLLVTLEPYTHVK